MSPPDLDQLCARMRRFPDALALLVEGLAPEHARWAPSPEAWSVVEIVNHLADEEDEDFRARVRSTLEDPSRPWSAIDPAGAVRARGHGGRDLVQSLQRFADERSRSLAWLAGLRDPQWSRTYQHPALGPLSAGDLMASWAAHDWLHLRQVGRRMAQWVGTNALGGSTDYAGPP